MSAFTTVIVRISKTNTKRLTVGKKWARNLIYLDVVVALGQKEEINLLAAKFPQSSMSAMLFALIFP